VAEHPTSGTFNAIAKMNADSGECTLHDFGKRIVGEPVFIPRKAGRAEDDGFLATFAFDPVNATSRLVLLDATCIDADPIAEIELPQRVPQGLHGSWIPA
jgi:carotenoid cleavage dioxygenase-like enzyme